MTMLIDDGYQQHEVVAVGYDDDDLQKQPGITTKNGWCSLGYYITQYASYETNTELTAYCKLYYPEYFI